MTLHNEPLSNFKLYHISFFNNDIWFSFMSNKTEKRTDDYNGQTRDWVNTYSLQYSKIKDLIPIDNEDLSSYIVGFHRCQRGFRLDYLAEDFKQQTKKDLTNYLSRGSQTIKPEELDKIFKI